MLRLDAPLGAGAVGITGGAVGAGVGTGAAV